MFVDRRPRRPVRVLTLICVAYTRIVWLPLVCVCFSYFVVDSSIAVVFGTHRPRSRKCPLDLRGLLLFTDNDIQSRQTKKAGISQYIK
jgi:hypothetical protein